MLKRKSAQRRKRLVVTANKTTKVRIQLIPSEPNLLKLKKRRKKCTERKTLPVTDKNEDTGKSIVTHRCVKFKLDIQEILRNDKQ